ncbi:hypothetical protein HXX76_014959 [Chlamydomonas incerta]|uniref:Uncharacterized protein n=1 Tax=Chlamydomonas incerta TaxID=51695 RepID=A0A835SQ07_CHLIN|nr:hypothetical protein HXX76_014959 [Chlamydomonas incerta]|eukprot:KAG2423906.1 hypothetical protein HXX76_014959 [Chlamydomonas incerta]
MARPKSSNKAAKQKGVAVQGKRKHGGGPRGGGPSGRPAKQSRREGRSKPVDNDVFEAEDSDPDEVKNAKRFDEVENYEYELPSDFEDEEIDEEMAFTEEDKKKFGAWFEKEVDADEDDDEDGGTLGVGDDDGDVWDGDEDDEDEEGDEEEEEEVQPARGAKGSRKRSAPEREQEEDADDDDGLFLDEDDDEDEDEDDMDGEGDEEDDDEERHLAMLRDVLEGGGKGGRAGAKRARDPNAAVLSEAYPESEYGLNPGAASAGGLGGLSIADLLAGLTGEERRKLGAARRLLEKVGGAAGDGDDAGAGGKRKTKKGGADKGGSGGGGSSLRPVPVPLPGIVADRQERKAGYEAAAEDVTKWTSIVKANREAPTLRLVAGRDEVPRVTTTAALVAQHTPSADNALEAEVAALLQAAGAANAEALEEAEEKLALKALSLEEARERRERLAKLRSLLFYHELKSRRLKAIKSKEYHRHLAKAAKRKATKLAAAAADGAAAGDGDVEAAAARAAAIEAEFQRAKERLTQRHRNTSRWARRALKRGKLEVDPGTKAALAEQIQLGQQLKRKIEGRRGSGSEDDDDSDASTSASEGEGAGGGGGAGGRAGGRTRSAALELLAGGGAGGEGEDAPKKGLLALPFMKRALERRRLAAAAEAEELLRELDEQAAAGGVGGEGVGGGFGDDGEGDEDGGAKGAGGDALERLVGYGVPAAAANGTAGRRRFGGGGAAAAAAGQADGDADEEFGSDMDSDDAEDAEAKAERLGRKTKEAAAADAASRKQQQRQVAAAAKKAKRGAAAAAPPTAAEQADLDAALAAGAAGRGLLVSSEADLVVEDDADVDQERRRSGGAASTRGGGGGGGGGAGVLAEVAAQRGSVSSGRAGLFQGKRDGAATGAAAAAAAAANGSGGDGAAAKFVASKKFVGARPGYAFQKGPQGIGYYLDPKQPLAAALAQPAAAGAGGAKGAKGAAAAAAPVVVAGQAKPAQQQQQQQAGKGKQQQQAGKALEKQGGKGDADSAAGSDGDDDEAAPIMKAAPSNKDLIRQAFAADDVAAEFAEEKAAAVAEELPDIQEPSALPGWGAWSSQQRNPKWMQAAKDRAAKQRADAAAGRRDAGMKYVVVSEKWDKKAAKYTAPAAPFPFTSPEAYERSLRQPLGREYNPDQAFRDLTRPAIIKQAGVTINPLRFSEATAKNLGHKGRSAEAERESKKVVTVAGGMPRVGKGQVAK